MAESAQNDGVALADRGNGRDPAHGGPEQAGADHGAAANGVSLTASVASNEAPAEGSSAPIESPIQTPGLGRGLLRRLVPDRIRRRFAAARAWSHTPRALRLGTLSAGALALLTASVLAVVGFGGVGTHVDLPPAPPDTYGSGLSNDLYNIYPPVLPLPPLIAGPPLPSGSTLHDVLSRLVLQPYDVPIDFHRTDQGAVDGAAADGLLGSYHILFQRNLDSANSAELGGAISVISIAGVYRDVPAAAAQLEDEDLSGLGTLAGLPDLSADPVTIARVIGDETRIVHLTGESFGVQVGVYLVEFRRGAVDGIVALVASAGSESLPDALLLADRQEARLEQSAPPEP